MSDKVELVWMEKDGEKAQVHPTTVKSHQEAGWKLVLDAEKTEAADDADKTAAPTPKPAKPSAH